MNRVRILRIGGGVAAAALAGGMWMSPAWGSASRLPDSIGAKAQPAAAMPDMPAMPATAGGDAVLTQKLAAARRATARYVTNLGLAKKNGYMQITPVMTDMGVHFLNPKISGFSVTKPQILVYEKHGKSFQLGALEWVFPAMPKNPPLPNATFGQFPAACHYADGNFIPMGSQSGCPKTEPKTGAKFTFWHPLLITMHVWIWYPNPAGLFSSTNPLVSPFNKG
jgi:hypothetical protein